METSKDCPRRFINYAHRGASEYAPENTLLAFYTGVSMHVNGIETDVQRTRDGVLVLFHDATLERVTGQPGCVSDYTVAELRGFYVQKNGLRDRIVTLEAFLEAFSFMDLRFAIELKQADLEKDVVDLLNEYDMLEKTCVTSFQLGYLKNVLQYDPRYRVGLLTESTEDGLIAELSALGVAQVCPKASDVTPKLVSRLHAGGFQVRAWGVTDEREMRRVYDGGADGMTVNFPDRLEAYIRERGTREARKP